MSLEIVSSHNVVKVSGEINKNNVELFKERLLLELEKFNRLTLNIECLRSVDRFGVNALADLHVKSLALHKQLYIVGLGCKELYDHFKSKEMIA
jgi:anti-anti-sigma factor